MATQTIEARAPSGQTITAKLFSPGNDTIVASVTATEATNRKGTYLAAFTDVAAGEYLIILFAGSTPLSSYWVTLTLVTATFQVSEASAGSIRAAVGMSVADLDDQLEASLMSRYDDGAVWVKAVGDAGTVVGINGTATNPCPWADALTIATSLGTNRFRILMGETITLAASTENKTMIGEKWTLALGGQAIGGSRIVGAEVSGIGTNTTPTEFENCHINNTTTIGPTKMIRCGLNSASGTPLTGGSAGDFQFIDCYSEIGAAAPYFVFTGATTVQFRRYSGGANITLDANTGMIVYECLAGGDLTAALAGGDIEIRGIVRDVTLTGIAGTSVIRFAGITGSITLEGANGAATVSGVCGTLTDNRTGAPTLTNTAGLNSSLGDLPTLSEIFAGTGDASITLAKMIEMVAAYLCGIVTATSAAGVTTYVFKKRDGITTSFEVEANETGNVGTRDITGALS